jgi:hypothetical protein
MIRFMRPHPFFASPGRPCSELVLRDPDGGAWVLRLSAGMEKFIGAYPRIDDFGGDGPLLLFRAAGQPA